MGNEASTMGNVEFRIRKIEQQLNSITNFFETNLPALEQKLEKFEKFGDRMAFAFLKLHEQNEILEKQNEQLRDEIQQLCGHIMDDSEFYHTAQREQIAYIQQIIRANSDGNCRRMIAEFKELRNLFDFTGRHWYKTKLCRYGASCLNKNVCTFAHDQSELRTSSNVTNFLSKIQSEMMPNQKEDNEQVKDESSNSLQQTAPMNFHIHGYNQIPPPPPQQPPIAEFQVETDQGLMGVIDDRFFNK